MISLPLKERFKAYLELAGDLDQGRIDTASLPLCAASLPPPDEQVLAYLEAQVEEAQMDWPRWGWALMAVAEAAANHLAKGPYLPALAAWQLGRAAHYWVRPARVSQAIGRARSGFAALGEDGWLVACDWIENALPWASLNFKQAETRLAQAVLGLQQAGFSHFLPHCRLSLAYAQVLQWDFAAAEESLAASEQVFLARQDPFNLAHCLLIRASAARRQAQYDLAFSHLQAALDRLAGLAAPVMQAKIDFQMAYCHLERQDDLEAVEVHFKRAAGVFEARDLPLWAAFCYNGLAQLYNTTGLLGEAGGLLHRAREVYSEFEVNGPLADNLVDSGRFEKLRGNFRASISFFQRAEKLYEQLGGPLISAITTLYQGEAYREQGRYQLALKTLELALERFKPLGNSYRLAECELHLARVWLSLCQPEKAHGYLDQALQHCREINSGAILAEIYNERAAVFFLEDKGSEAIPYLQEALAIAQEHQAQGQIAFGQRLLGEALCAVGRREEALGYLKAAQASFAETGMVTEQAAALVALGKCYADMALAAEAASAWQQAILLSQEVQPDIAWQSHAGLGRLAEAAGDQQAALNSYRQSVYELGKMRRGFWQPSLAGAYLQRPAPALSRAVDLAARAGTALDLLIFIEESKAQTFARHFAAGDRVTAAGASDSKQLADLSAEIRWLQEQLRVSFATNGLLPGAAEKQLRRQLVEKIRLYETITSQLERKQTPALPADLPDRNFTLDHFRELAGQALGEAWVALDYYLAETALELVVLTADRLIAYRLPIPGGVRFALDIFVKRRQNGYYPNPQDLQELGRFLFPEPIPSLITAGACLLIAPHRRLHRLPWAALQVGAASQDLAAACIPVVAPSFQSLATLWQRDGRPRPARQDGLILGISNFSGRRQPLPQAAAEVGHLSQSLGAGGQILAEGQATWENLLALRREDGLARFAFLHIASHAFHDPVTGRLSGIALHDRDTWLDQLWELAPLPNLITLSACHGTQSLVHPGDEHVGLATTCLAAGAGSIVGSLWPVLDEDAASLMNDFYNFYWAGQSAGLSLALAQRAALSRGSSPAKWGSFTCIGLPGEQT